MSEGRSVGCSLEAKNFLRLRHVNLSGVGEVNARSRNLLRRRKLHARKRITSGSEAEMRGAIQTQGRRGWGGSKRKREMQRRSTREGETGGEQVEDRERASEEMEERRREEGESLL